MEPAANGGTAATETFDVDRTLRRLRRDYTGIWGLKVVILAGLTLLPFFVQTRLLKGSWLLSIPLLVFLAYHATGLMVWARVRQLDGRTQDRFDHDERKQWVQATSKLASANGVLSWLTGVLLVLQTMLLVTLQDWRVPLTPPAYRFLDMPVPIHSHAAALDARVEALSERRAEHSEPCKDLVPLRLDRHIDDEQWNVFDVENPKLLVCWLRMPTTRTFEWMNGKFDGLADTLDQYPSLVPIWRTETPTGTREAIWEHESRMLVVVTLWVDETESQPLEKRQAEAVVELVIKAPLSKQSDG